MTSSWRTKPSESGTDSLSSSSPKSSYESAAPEYTSISTGWPSSPAKPTATFVMYASKRIVSGPTGLPTRPLSVCSVEKPMKPLSLTLAFESGG